MAPTPTADPFVFIEEARPGYVRYQARDPDDPGRVVRRWEVHGVCDRRGDCLVGAIVPHPETGEPVEIRSKAHLERLGGGRRLDSELDVPVTPEFDSCCGDDLFSYVELPVA